ncbi:MAG: diacylglycerol kinase family protein [Anaerolineae bacterium]|nr:diacylglycerol kinase family protein [Anaerolineae bacterium]
MNKGEPAGHSTNRLESFRHAFAGWQHLLKTQPNARIHLAFTIGIMGMGLWLNLDGTSWAILWLVIGLVITAEFFNSAIEAVVDIASPTPHPLAKAAKDMGAGGVLFAACVAVIIGLLVLGPPLMARLIDWLKPTTG